MQNHVSNHTSTSPQEAQEHMRRENAKKPPYAPYSIQTHDAARDLWITGWNDARIAEALGIPRRETITEWARRENWLAIQRDCRKRTLEKTVEVTAQKTAEANARQLGEINALKLKVFHELTKNPQVQGKSVEGLVRTAIGALAFERQVMGLDDEMQAGDVEHGSSFLDEYESMLERVKDDPKKSADLIRLNKERLLLEAQMRQLAAIGEPHVDTDSAAA